ncbi:Hypothetical protein ORPV_825 [Orpheovirus IHUMI-LCC2]|uniref:Uncharacterized protein n=1 Tax=Orpheovirus IHUMI-LCC2 TaxID=2023057 RepID=A0A2I2L5J7_9VIRU|nr:Hypothetical protein ORPV_825 [Orpheovirus IHUMI-LCC2]SNW62729.1 Hypothetical protein ORPV_825 [Orpheovirus IHUMI-LCC2]
MVSEVRTSYFYERQDYQNVYEFSTKKNANYDEYTIFCIRSKMEAVLGVPLEFFNKDENGKMVLYIRADSINNDILEKEYESAIRNPNHCLILDTNVDIGYPIHWVSSVLPFLDIPDPYQPIIINNNLFINLSSLRNVEQTPGDANFTLTHIHIITNLMSQLEDLWNSGHVVCTSKFSIKYNLDAINVIADSSNINRILNINIREETQYDIPVKYGLFKCNWDTTPEIDLLVPNKTQFLLDRMANLPIIFPLTLSNSQIHFLVRYLVTQPYRLHLQFFSNFFVWNPSLDVSPSPQSQLTLRLDYSDLTSLTNITSDDAVLLNPHPFARLVTLSRAYQYSLNAPLSLSPTIFQSSKETISSDYLSLQEQELLDDTVIYNRGVSSVIISVLSSQLESPQNSPTLPLSLSSPSTVTPESLLTPASKNDEVYNRPGTTNLQSSVFNPDTNFINNANSPTNDILSTSNNLLSPASNHATTLLQTADNSIPTSNNEPIANIPEIIEDIDYRYIFDANSMNTFDLISDIVDKKVKRIGNNYVQVDINRNNISKELDQSLRELSLRKTVFYINKGYKSLSRDEIMALYKVKEIIRGSLLLFDVRLEKSKEKDRIYLIPIIDDIGREHYGKIGKINVTEYMGYRIVGYSKILPMAIWNAYINNADYIKAIDYSYMLSSLQNMKIFPYGKGGILINDMAIADKFLDTIQTELEGIPSHILLNSDYNKELKYLKDKFGVDSIILDMEYLPLWLQNNIMVYTNNYSSDMLWESLYRTTTSQFPLGKYYIPNYQFEEDRLLTSAFHIAYSLYLNLPEELRSLYDKVNIGDGVICFPIPNKEIGDKVIESSKYLDSINKDGSQYQFIYETPNRDKDSLNLLRRYLKEKYSVLFPILLKYKEKHVLIVNWDPSSSYVSDSNLYNVPDGYVAGPDYVSGEEVVNVL